MADKKVLVIGSGGRCHAIVDALSRSERVSKIYCAPGNAGIASQAECVDIAVGDVEALARFARENGIDMTVVGPEASLAAGVSDRFRELGMKIIGPGKEGTQIESSKEFAKRLMLKYGVPTGSYESFSEFAPALEYVKARPLPAVIKYDGLAAGKGVVIATSYEEAEKALRDMLEDKCFGNDRVIIEEFLDGHEFSFMCLVSGRKVYPLATAQDYKRVNDGDEGPNTGGMGAYSPVPFVSEAVLSEAFEKVMQRTADALADEGIDFTGLLYGGLILTADGVKVIEFNARFGDPETEVVLPRLKSDFYSLLEAVADGKDFDIEWRPEACVGVVLAADGYPGSYPKGMEIVGAENGSDGFFYHMGTRRDGDRLLSAGGRVLIGCALAPTAEEARVKAYRLADGVTSPEFHYRKDIGLPH